MRLLKTLFLFILGTSSLLAQDSAIYTLDREQIVAFNIQTLEEALDYIPGFHLVTRDGQRELHYGVLTLQGIGIYKDNIPLAMDQNIGYDLSTIAAWDLQKIEIRYATLDEVNKSGGAIAVHLYSRQAAKKPWQADGTIINNTLGDLNTNASISWSTLKHSFRIAGNRGFQREMYDINGLRATAIHPSQRYDLNLAYTFKPFRSIEIQVGSDNTSIDERSKGKLIEETTRAQDTYLTFNRNHHFARITSNLSKNHKLIVGGTVQRYRRDAQAVSKDLHTGKKEESTLEGNQDLRFNFLRIAIESSAQPLSYAAGIELSNTKDLANPIINAIPTEYSDYTAFARFGYRYKNNFSLNGGIRFLNNNLTGAYILPSARLVLAPSNVLALSITFKESITYPAISQVFAVPTAQGTSNTNNLLLNPVQQDIIHIKADISQEGYRLSTGILFVNQTRIPTLGTMEWENKGRNRSTTTYASIRFQNEYLSISPSAMIHGISSRRDTNNLVFFTPELSIDACVKIPKTSISISSVFRVIGKRTTTLLTKTLVQDEINSIRLLTTEINLRPSKSLPLTLHLGSANLLNTTFISNKKYQLLAIDRQLLSDITAVAYRPRNFYVRASYTLQ